MFILQKKRLTTFLVLIFSLFFIVSCYKKQENKQSPFFIKAEKFYTEGNYPEAKNFYQKYLTLYPNSPQAHYNVATIFLEQDNYIQAIFHYKRFLELKPDTPDREAIESWIKASQASLYKKLEKKYSGEKNIFDKKEITKNIELESELEKLKKKNEQMRNFIVKHKEVLLNNPKESKTPEKKVNKKEEITHENFNTYEVQQGDTLYKISAKMYNSSKYYINIWEANKDRLNSPSSLKPGDVLVIPEIN